MTDQEAMWQAIRLSAKGFPAPNPHVGCVIVREGVVVGQGYHDHAGGPHAEVAALQNAGEKARGAAVFVTLEPCNHTGRTGPCSEALLQAGVSRVVVAVTDPNPAASGGIERLRSAGIEVALADSGLVEEAAKVNYRFLFAMRHRRPFVTVKAAMSLDGRIALPSGESRWITGEEARMEGHRLRAEMGAVLVGRRTVEVDDPALTARIPGVVNQPLRVVLDPKTSLKDHYKVFNGDAPTLHITGQKVAVKENGLDLDQVLQAVFSEGATGLLVEGGGVTVSNFLRASLVDRLELFVGAKILGAGPSWVQGALAPDLASLPSFRLEGSRFIGKDLHLTLEPQRSH